MLRVKDGRAETDTRMFGIHAGGEGGGRPMGWGGGGVGRMGSGARGGTGEGDDEVAERMAAGGGDGVSVGKARRLMQIREERQRDALCPTRVHTEEGRAEE